MTTRIVVFPVNGRKWAFTAVAQALQAEREQAATTRQLLEQLRRVDSLRARAELTTHFVADKVKKILAPSRKNGLDSWKQMAGYALAPAEMSK